MHKPKSGKKEIQDFMQLEIIQPYAIPDAEEQTDEIQEEKPANVIEIVKPRRRKKHKYPKPAENSGSSKPVNDKENDIQPVPENPKADSESKTDNSAAPASTEAPEPKERVDQKIPSTLHTSPNRDLLLEAIATLRELIEFNENPLKTYLVRTPSPVVQSKFRHEDTPPVVPSVLENVPRPAQKPDQNREPLPEKPADKPRLSFNIQENRSETEQQDNTLSEVIKRSFKNPNFFGSSFKKDNHNQNDDTI